MSVPSPEDDRPHATRANGLVEWWQFDGWSAAEGLGLWVQFGWSSTDRRAWYCAVVADPGEPVVLVVDPDIAVAELSPSLEFRAEGIWAQHVCETPLTHWTVGLEAFGVTLSDPRDALGDQWGTRTAVGLDVEWEASSPGRFARRGELVQECAVHGEVLIDDRVVDYDGRGVRRHGWGSPPARLQGPPPPDAWSLAVRLERAGGPEVLELRLDPAAGWSSGRGEAPSARGG